MRDALLSSSTSTPPCCPHRAEVVATPLLDFTTREQCELSQCRSKTVPRSTLGALITITEDKLNAKDTLQKLLQGNVGLRLDMLYVAVDFRNKTLGEENDSYRRGWARSNVDTLQHMADEMQQHVQAPVMVELIDMSRSCMGHLLAETAFNGYARSGCGVQGMLCDTSTWWKNTVAFSWGMMRMAQCVRHVVHVDNDIRLAVQPSAPSWIQRAIGVLQSREDLLSVHPLRGPGPSCGRGTAAASMPKCHCRAGRDPHSGGLTFRRSFLMPQSNFSQPTCLLTYEGPHKPDFPHFSIQAFVVDVQRFQRIWPLTPYHFENYGPYDSNKSTWTAMRADFLRLSESKRGINREAGHVDPEGLFEENARRQALDIVYISAAELGVSKDVHGRPRGGRKGL